MFDKIRIHVRVRNTDTIVPPPVLDTNEQKKKYMLIKVHLIKKKRQNHYKFFKHFDYLGTLNY